MVAEEDGNLLGEAWVGVLKCVSRFEQLHLVAEGALADAILFAPKGGDQEGYRPLITSTSLSAMHKCDVACCLEISAQINL